MERRVTVLIADRNPRIRQFLRREFASEGYFVLLAEDGNDLSQIIRRDNTLDLLILDDEILTLEGHRMVEQLGNRIPPLPFIIHSFSTECVDLSLARAAAASVKKDGNIEELKRLAEQVLRTDDRHRLDRPDRKPGE